MGLLDTTTALPTEPTWGAALRTIERERTMPSWERIGQKAPARDHIFTHYEKRGHFNALLQRDNDPKREQKFRDNRDAAFSAKQARCKQQQASFDIVSHRQTGGLRPVPASDQQKNGKPKPPDTNTKWNIITHVGREGCEPFTSSKDRLAAAHGELLPASWKRREYDIVSTKYNQNHTARHHRDRENAKHKAQKKFWETRDFDFIKIKYHDDDKESDFQQQRSHLNSIAGAGAMAKLPPAMQHCEGAAYNLVSHEIKDASKLEVSNAVTTVRRRVEDGRCGRQAPQERRRGTLPARQASSFTTVQQDVASQRDDGRAAPRLRRRYRRKLLWTEPEVPGAVPPPARSHNMGPPRGVGARLFWHDCW